MSESAPAWFAEMVLPAVRLVDTSSISPGREPDPIEIDPRPCDSCGLTIDRHERVDTPEGPEFFCIDLAPDEMTLPELERRAELIRQVEVAEIMARMDAMDTMDRSADAINKIASGRSDELPDHVKSELAADADAELSGAELLAGIVQNHRKA
jgi:hypothetical protein